MDFHCFCIRMSVIGTIHEDVTTDVLGHIGPWQWLVVFISTSFLMPSMLNQFEDMFLLGSPRNIQCFVSDTVTISNSTLCSYFVANSTNEYRCSKWHVNFLWLIWIKKTWLVFCDTKIRILSTTIICRLGLIFGFIIFGLFSDNFGRKRSIAIDIFAELGFRLILTFCDSDSWFNLLIFLRSIFASANFYMGIVLICEIASSTWRTILIMIVSTPRLLSALCLVPIVNIAPNQETFNFIACIFDVFLIIILRWTPESPQWLLYNRRISQAEEILLKAVKINRVGVCSNFKIRPVNHRAYDCLDESLNCIGILTTYNIRILTITILVFWSFYYFLWSSLYLRIYTKYEQYTLLQLIVIATLLAFFNWCIKIKLKLRSLLILNILTIGACSVSLIFINWLKLNHTITSIISSVSLGIGVVVHGLILNITPRLFAINIRATLFGCCHSSGQLGSIICYLIVMFQAMDEFTFMIIEASLTVGLTFLCYMLPDVDGRELPDVLGDMDYFSELSKPLRWVAQKTNSPSHEEFELRVYSFSSGVQASNSNSYQRLPARRRLHFIQLTFQRLIQNINPLINRNIQ